MFNFPLKTWLYAGALAVLLGAFGWYTVHERSVQHEKDIAADKRVVDAQTIHNTEVETRAKVLTEQAVAKLKASLAAPPAADAPHLVCRTPARAGAVRADGGARPAADAAPVISAEVASIGNPDPVDFGPEIDKLFSDADATIVALQAYIQTCIDQKLCKASTP